MSSGIRLLLPEVPDNGDNYQIFVAYLRVGMHAGTWGSFNRLGDGYKERMSSGQPREAGV